MRGTRVGMGLLSAALLGVAGCQTPDTTIKPPLHEEYIIPPSDDPRFSSPPAFPKETLDSSLFKKQPNKPGDPLQAPGRFGAGSGGMGRY